MKIHNFFDFEVKDSKGKITKRAHAENIVLNQFISRIVSGNSCFNNICVGTGTEEPAVTDTKLSEYIACKSADLSGVSVDWDNMIFSVRKSVIFQADELAGKTLTEVGVSYNSSENSLCTHALIRDENGNVSSITKSSTEILTVHATVYADLSNVEKDGVYNQRYPISSSILNIDILPVLARWALGVGSIDVGVCSCLAYDSVYPRNLYTCSIKTSENTVKIIHPDITISQYNNIAIKSVIMGHSGSLCMTVPNVNFTQPEIKNELVGMGDGSLKTFNTKFSLIKSAAVKVDGSEVSDVVVNYGMPKYAEQCFKLYDYPRKYSSDEQNAAVPIALLTNTVYVSALDGAWSIFENIYSNKGVLIKKCSFEYITVSLSNDLSTWTQIRSNNTIPEELQNAHFWKIETAYTLSEKSYRGLYNIEWTRPADIVFSEPPLSGSEITVDYTPDCIAKDANHILRGIEFDVTFNA